MEKLVDLCYPALTILVNGFMSLVIIFYIAQEVIVGFFIQLIPICFFIPMWSVFSNRFEWNFPLWETPIHFRKSIDFHLFISGHSSY